MMIREMQWSIILLFKQLTKEKGVKEDWRIQNSAYDPPRTRRLVA